MIRTFIERSMLVAWLMAIACLWWGMSVGFGVFQALYHVALTKLFPL